jgi:hypothetical protein
LSELAVEYQGKYCRKMHQKWEKQKSSTPAGGPLQRAGSELKKPGFADKISKIIRKYIVEKYC